MLTGLDQTTLLAENLDLGPWRPRDEVRQELTHLALTVREGPYLAAEIFERFRKVSGQDIAMDYLGAVQDLASTGTAAGARLLAAFLNVASPGQRLVPLVIRLDSCRRYAEMLKGLPGGLGPFQADWLQRAEGLQVKAKLWAASEGVAPAETGPDGPRRAEPWRLMRAVLADLVGRAGDDGFDGPAEGAELLTGLLRLEVDARQERTSILAGSIHPFRVETVARVLPLLNRSDAAIRDLRLLATATAQGDYETAFVRPQARWRETLDEKDWGHLRADLERHPPLAAMARLAEGLGDNPVPAPQLALGTRRIIDLSAALVEDGSRDEPFDLFTACLLAQTHYGNGQIVFAVDPELAESLDGILPDPANGDEGHPLAGVSLVAGLLVLDLPADEPDWPDGLPVLREMTDDEDRTLRAWRKDNAKLDPADLETMRKEALALAKRSEGEVDEEDEDEVIDMDIAALKHLVLTNLQSVSILLGFLRNPKVFAVPGLVEEIVNRTRNPQIIETIATDRALHTGFANKGVALACLRSPVNVSVKVLRKFCHVKYVSKVDLKRLAADRTGVRKEVGREIQKYLEALA